MDSTRINYLIAGSFASGSILIMLFIIRMSIPELLDIDVKWLAIAGIPLVISLIAGRFIRGFKGMGVELEMQLASPVINASSVIEATSQVSSTTKEGLQALEALPPEKKISANVLTFREDGYYVSGDVRKYLETLPKVRFFEVIDPDLKLKFLIDIRDLRQRIANDDTTVNNVIKIIQGTAEEQTDTRNNIILQKIQTTDTLLQAFDKIKESNKDILPVVDKTGKLFGLLYKKRLTEAIANEVAKALRDGGSRI